MNNESEILKAQIEALKQLVAIKDQIIDDLNKENFKLRANVPTKEYIPVPIYPAIPSTPPTMPWYNPYIITSTDFTLPPGVTYQTVNNGPLDPITNAELYNKGIKGVQKIS